MKRNRNLLIVGALAFITMIFLTPVFAAEVTIKGTISEKGIVADDGEVYAVAETDKGKELIGLVDKKVEVTGSVEEREGKKVITVTNYKVTE
jgi:outer membrane usher protein FimD/PapC